MDCYRDSHIVKDVQNKKIYINNYGFFCYYFLEQLLKNNF